MLTTKMKASIVTGAFLGLVCILGAGFRMGYSGNALYLTGLWYNRLLMGILLGFTSPSPGLKGLVFGGFMGFLVSLAFYLSTGFTDFITFIAGIIYGVIIVAVIRRYKA